MVLTNTLAYHIGTLITTVKRFTEQALGASIIKLITTLINSVT